MPRFARFPLRGRIRRWSRRKWLSVIGSVLLVLVVFWVVLPSIVAGRLESQLSRRLGTPVSLDDVDLSLLGPTVVVHGLRWGAAPEMVVKVPELEARWSWRGLLFRRSPPVIRVIEPTIGLRLDPNAPPEDRSPQTLSLGGFKAVHVVDGSANIEMLTPDGVVDMRVDAIALSLVNTVPPGKALTTRVRASATIGSGGSLTLSGACMPLRPAEGWALDFELRDLDVVPFNPLWNSILEMDTSEGVVNLKGDVSRSGGRIRGRIEPRFVGLRMLGLNEKARHPMGEALFSEMLSGAANAMLFDVPTDPGEGQGLASLMEQDWEAVIEGVIQRGYQRQLDTLTGYSSHIGGVTVDFGDARLRLEDVSIFRDSGLVDHPFIFVKALEVRFDESVTKQDVRSYKHITLVQPVLTFVAHEEEERRQMNFDPEWPTKVSTLPFQTADLHVEDGTIRFIEHRGESTTEVAVTQIQLDGRRMARAMLAPGERGATIDAKGMVLSQSEIRVHVEYEPLPDEGNVHFEIGLDPLPLELLNPLARTHAGIDASEGTFGVEAMFDLQHSRFRAETTLHLVNPKLIGEEERKIEHPLREFMLTSRMRKLGGKKLSVELDRDYATGLFTQVGMALLSEALGTSRR